MIYLDHAATTQILPEAVAAASPWVTGERFGNPSSQHKYGRSARNAIEHAREQVARMINADPEEIFFTSGGTESNNAWMSGRELDLVITTPFEHRSVLEPIDCASEKVEMKILPDGRPDIKWVRGLLCNFNRSNIAFSVQWVNNETGEIIDMKSVDEFCDRRGILLHTDAIQAIGHIPVDVKKCKVDMLSMSGHKFGAMMGVGALYIRKGVGVAPLILGGGQESGWRSGTENVPGIVSMGAAAEVVLEKLPQWLQKWSELRSIFLDLVGLHFSRNNIKWKINGGANVAQNIISITVYGVHSESLVSRLSLRGICISAGAACNANHAGVSKSLLALGLTEEDAVSTIRVSMGASTTLDEIKEAAVMIPDCARWILNNMSQSNKTH